MKDHGFGLIRDRCNEKQKVLRDFEDNGFKRFSGVNWSVVRVRYWSVDWDSNKDGRSVLSRRIQDSRPDIKGRRVFSWIFKCGNRCRHGLLIAGYGGLREIKGGS